MKDMNNIIILSAFGDNYIYLFEYAPGQCLVIDPGDATAVLDLLKMNDLMLTHVFVTHHHADHIGGIQTLKKETRCELIGSDRQRISGIDTVICDGQSVKLDSVTLSCLNTPGHTTTSVCYFVSGDQLESPVLFTGDTLFVCGCGRMFETSGEIMYQSLQKLTTLPDETLIYPGHDYTEENLRFALTLNPDNKLLQAKLNIVRNQSKNGLSMVPSTLAEERQVNPFLLARNWQEFAKLRRKKDTF
jgi:hydroxyacylglutathione hydrolase